MKIYRIRCRRSVGQSENKHEDQKIQRSHLFAKLLTLVLAIVGGPVFSQVTTGVFSAEDEQYLMQVAEPHIEVTATASGVAQATTQQNRRELLLMEPRMASAKSSNPKQEADIYVYDYATDEVIHLVVDLNDRSVSRQERVRNMQLPLTEAEVKRAMDVLFVDEANSLAIGEEFYQITGRRLESVHQIKYKAFVFLAASVSETKQINTGECGLRRCAKILLYTADNISLDLSPIIDLSNERVLQIADNPQEGG